MISVTVDIRVRFHSPGAVTRIERALKMAVERKPGRGVRFLPRTVRMNLNEPPGSTFWPMSLRPVQLYVHSRKTYARRRFQEVTHTRDAIEAMNHVRQRVSAERKGS